MNIQLVPIPKTISIDSEEIHEALSEPVSAIVDAVRRGWARLRGTVAKPLDTAKWVPVTLVVTGVLGIMSALLVYADIVKPISVFGG